MALITLMMAGCAPVDMEAGLYQTVKRGRSKAYTIYNYPAVYLTTGEQNIRSRKQADSVRDHIKSGMTENELAALWGRPNDIQKSNYPGRTFDTFIYESMGGRYLRTEHYYFIFRDKKLESWHRL